MIATIAEIQKFLDTFHEKVRVFDIIFLNEREKNAQSLAALEITPNDQLNIVKSIEVTDYSEGPITDMLNRWGGDLWVFGKNVNEQEVYIKISYGRPNSKAICISFHIAEFPMKFPYRKERS